MNIVEEKQHLFEKSIEHLKKGLGRIRTGRANPELVENLSVEIYGISNPLKQIANISAPDPSSIIIQPWDKNAMKEIEKAIQNSKLGFNPVNEGNLIRVPIPPLTEDRRKEMVKLVNQKVEETKVSIRNIREDIWKTIKEQKTEGQITEDDLYKFQKELQQIIDDNNKQIDKVEKEKEKKILTI